MFLIYISEEHYINKNGSIICYTRRCI